MKTYNDIYLETRNALRASGIEGYTLEARTPPPPSTRRFRS